MLHQTEKHMIQPSSNGRNYSCGAVTVSLVLQNINYVKGENEQIALVLTRNCYGGVAHEENKVAMSRAKCYVTVPLVARPAGSTRKGF